MGGGCVLQGVLFGLSFFFNPWNLMQDALARPAFFILPSQKGIYHNSMRCPLSVIIHDLFSVFLNGFHIAVKICPFHKNSYIFDEILEILRNLTKYFFKAFEIFVHFFLARRRPHFEQGVHLPSHSCHAVVSVQVLQW